MVIQFFSTECAKIGAGNDGVMVFSETSVFMHGSKELRHTPNRLFSRTTVLYISLRRRQNNLMDCKDEND